MNIFKEAFSSKISKKQCTDSGMAATLIFLIAGMFTKDLLFFKIATASLGVTMAIPILFYPFAIIWFRLAHLLGTIISKILLSIIYIIIVLPVAVIRRISSKDTL